MRQRQSSTLACFPSRCPACSCIVTTFGGRRAGQLCSVVELHASLHARQSGYHLDLRPDLAVHQYPSHPCLPSVPRGLHVAGQGGQHGQESGVAAGGWVLSASLAAFRLVSRACWPSCPGTEPWHRQPRQAFHGTSGVATESRDQRGPGGDWRRSAARQGTRGELQLRHLGASGARHAHPQVRRIATIRAAACLQLLLPVLLLLRLHVAVASRRQTSDQHRLQAESAVHDETGLHLCVTMRPK